jgi:Domain of unknown function (DUF4442)
MLPSSSNTRLFKIGMNLYPMFFGTGGKILHIQKDWKFLQIKLGRNIWSYNFVGTIFGGSMFAAADPFYMLMYLHILGKNDFVVWDKNATIKFIAPGKTTLYADFIITDDEIIMIREGINKSGFITFDKTTEWKDASGKVHAQITRTIYAASKEYYKNKQRTK